jgi:hypothetical protein
MTFSPAILPVVFELIDELDDEKKGIAAIWRELGAALRERGYFQPSYESVRRIVNAVREARREAYSKLKRAIVLTAEYLWNTRARSSIVNDVWTGADIERRRDEYRWRRL